MPYDTAIPVGSGGMGEVFKAFDPELGRWVALKYLRHDDPELVERLLREARAQARVDHPGVCQVYGVGEEEGRPYIAMQYVEGRHLHEAAEGLTLEQKVLLVQQVADAVQAAHAVGLIHRDLKPSNVLVAEGPEGELRPFVLDFGIAREREVEGLTVSGQVLGTPGYLSPEQALGQTATLDRRTDIFSLGVILYELLSGHKPFPGDSSVEVLVSLIEEEAVPLSRHLRSVPRDLETVVMRCLEKAPERRYPSARALADDLGRFLAGEPVLARPVSRLERLLRLARKHRLTAALAAAAALLAVGLVAVALGGWAKYTADLKRERDVAERNEREAEEVTRFLLGVFEVSDPDESHGETVTAREVLDRGAERIERELAGRPLVQGRLLGMMGEVYARLGLLDRAEPLLERALDRVLASPDRGAKAEIEARVRLADLHMNRSELDPAAELLAPLEELVDRNPDLEPRVVVQGLISLSRMHALRGDLATAEAVMTRAVALTEGTLGGDSALMGDLLNDRSTLFEQQDLWDQAIADARRAVAIRERHHGADDPRVATSLNNLGMALSGAGQLEEAVAVGERVLELRERLLGPDHPRTATALNNLALSCKKLGRLDRAEELYRRSLEIRVATFGPDHPRVATVYGNLAGVHLARGDLDRAEAARRTALAIDEAAFGPDHPNVAVDLSGLAAVAAARGQHAEAVRLLRRSLGIREAAYGPDSPNLVGPLRALADSQLALGNLDEARGSLERARRIAVAAHGEGNEQVAKVDAALELLAAARDAGGG